MRLKTCKGRNLGLSFARNKGGFNKCFNSQRLFQVECSDPDKNL